jgi:hypothetical protein
MKIETRDLIGPALDWAVAVCENIVWWAAEKPRDGLFVNYERTIPYTPSTNWAQGGPIVERKEIAIVSRGLDDWEASVLISTPRHPSFAYSHSRVMRGHKPLVAAMRAYVQHKMGSVVDVPDELINNREGATA